ncbi:hypothetical protein NCS52_01217400 [Fusarium sp. LHS14.1]|nr:hypothetical protein NCS52_01217400 [Fusarium sp. LHS14.1]
MQYYKPRTKHKHSQARADRSLLAGMTTHSVVADPAEIWGESPERWSDWTPVLGGWMRRRPSVPGTNRHTGKGYLGGSHKKRFRFNPVSNRTHVETATEELEFHWKDLNPVSVTSQDCDAGRDERDSKESRAAPPELESKHSKIAPNHELEGQLHGASSTMTLEKSKLDSFAAYVASTPNDIVTTSSSVTETSTTVATWIFGTIMAGVGVGTMRATQKTAEAGTRSAVAGESSALSGRKSAVAAEESARAATKSAQAAENGVAVMQKQLEFMIQSKQGPPPATNSSIAPPRR